MTFQATFRLSNFQFNSIQFFNSEHTLTIYIFTERQARNIIVVCIVGDN